MTKRPRSLQNKAVRVPLPRRKLRYREGGDNTRCYRALEVDFEGRCAYCLRHVDDSDAEKFEIDHFKPRSANGSHAYANLRFACDWCNLYKGRFWPTAMQRARHERLLDPCAEVDYGMHIFEVADGQLDSTPAGAFQISRLRLNRSKLVEARRKRERGLNRCEQLARMVVDPRVPPERRIELEGYLREMRRELLLMIPRIERRAVST